MIKKNCRIAALQMVSGPRVADNLEVAGRLVAEAVDQGAQLVALPEYFPIIGAADADRVRAREQFGNGPVQDWLAATAARHDVWIIAGSIPLTATQPHQMRNSTLVFNDGGDCVARYDKIHLFGFKKGAEAYNESAFIEPGDTPVAVDTPFGRIALSICYDLRFPRAVPLARAGRPDPDAGRLHRYDRPGALGNPAARPRHREPMLPARGRTGRPA